MLYKFKSQAAGDVIMMAPQAVKVLAAVGKEPAERGVIQVAAMPAAIEALEQAMRASQQRQNAPSDEKDDDADDSVPFHVRAQPFLELLRQSLAEGKDVMWGV